MSKCGFSSLNLFSALTWSARCPRSYPNRMSIDTPALNPNAPARCQQADELRLHQCHSIGSERLGLPLKLRHAVVNHRSWIGLCTSTTYVICFVTSIFCGSGTAAGACTVPPENVSELIPPARKIEFRIM